MSVFSCWSRRCLWLWVAAAALGLFHPPLRAAEQKLDSAAFAHGARVWAQNCARCHNMRDPKEFRDDLWRPIVAHMRVRAGLTGKEQRDILLFLQRSN